MTQLQLRQTGPQGAKQIVQSPCEPRTQPPRGFHIYSTALARLLDHLEQRI